MHACNGDLYEAAGAADAIACSGRQFEWDDARSRLQVITCASMKLPLNRIGS